MKMSRNLKILHRIKLNNNIPYLVLHRNAHNYPELNLDYLCDPSNISAISDNIVRRKGVGDIKIVQNLHEKLQHTQKSDPQYHIIKQQFISEALKIPNESHREVINYGTEPKIIKYLGSKPSFSFKPKEFHELAHKLNVMRTSQLGNVAGNRSYYFFGALAELEQALIKYSVKKLLCRGYKVISVPDILHSSIIESCGMNVKGERTQVYTLANNPELCLSGTSEMAIAGYFRNKTVPVQELPIKMAAVSRCYRAETSSIAEERGIYRVHQFTKVEMFAVTRPDQSEKILESFREFQEEHFSSLGFHLQTLDMPPHELGAPAYRKYDLEAWLPGRKIWGEVSSCSNCTDYQSRRLRIKYGENKSGGPLGYVHTVNGTACAVPRMLIALFETYQNEDGSVKVPEVLKPFLTFTEVVKEKNVPELKLRKIKR